MALTYYNAKQQMYPPTPNDYYRTHFQKLINDKWLETTTLHMIEMETKLGTFEFEEIEVRLIHAIEKSTGVKQGDDFREIVFQDIEQNAPKGLYYKFDGCYWITVNTDEYNRISKNIIARRCNNWFRYRDPYTGAIVSVPCIMEYDTASPSPQVDNDVITPNNHAILIIQGNERTYPMVEANARFIWGKRPFKITGYNNYMQNGINDPTVPLLYIDAYLDEISPYDDLENEIAYNFDKEQYSIQINQDDFSQTTGYTTTLTATVMQQGEIVQRDINWTSSDNTLVTIDYSGRMEIIGTTGTVTITASLSGNNNVTDSIQIVIEDIAQPIKEIRVSPMITKLAQGNSIVFQTGVYENDILQPDLVSISPSGATMEHYDIELVGNNSYRLVCKSLSTIPLMLTFQSGVLSKQLVIDLVSMF